MLAVKTGRADMYFVDYPSGAYLATKVPEVEIVVPTDTETYLAAFGVKKSNDALAMEMGKAFAQVLASGKMKSIAAEYGLGDVVLLDQASVNTKPVS
jgi:ABC-type amino acid transport substrate-binding protein